MKSHQDLIEFQRGLLERLVNREKVTEIARDSRKFMTAVYGRSNELGIPNGAELGINVNSRCNLRCRHCYYANTHLENSFKDDEENSLSEEEWTRVVDEAVDLGMNHFNIIGKEPLLDPKKTRTILSVVNRHNESRRKLRYELITNGTLIDREIEWLKDFKDFYFFSVSFDGYEKDHDDIRGKGNYQKARNGLRIVHEAGIKNLAATFCAMPHNVKSLNVMLEDLTSLGLEYLSIGLCFPTEYNEKKVCAGLPVFDEILSEVKNAPENLDISIGLMGDEHADLIVELFKKGYFNQKLAVAQDCAPSLVNVVNDKPRTAVHFSLMPVMFYSGFRMDYDGTAIDFVQTFSQQKEKVLEV